MNYKKLIIIAIIVLTILLAAHKRKQIMNEASNHPVAVAQPVQVVKHEILSPEEKAEIQRQQELILKEAEQLKIKQQLTEEKQKLVAEYDQKLNTIEQELSTIRSNKISFQFSPRQNESQRQLTKQNAGPTVSVITLEDLERLGIGNSYQQRTELTQKK